MLLPHPSRSLWSALWISGLVATSRAVSVPFFKSSTSTRSSSPSFVISSNKELDALNDSFSFQNINDVEGSDIYVAMINVGGQMYEVQLDTGSSDLWLDTSGVDLSDLEPTGINSEIAYGDGTVAAGPVFLGNVTFGNFTINQAFISAPGSNATTNGDKGLLGVGPPFLSAVRTTLQGTQFNGDSLLENIFTSDPSLQTFITFELGRSETTGTTDGGVFTIGEVNSSFTAIQQAPQLQVQSDDRWVVFMDGVVVNGQNITGMSAFNRRGQAPGQTLANLDTGTSLAQIPQTYADAIYGSIPGAQFFESQSVYVVPCDAQINISFVFSGVEYPIHPIDVIAATTDDNGQITCFSGFPVGDGTSDSEDFLLGDSFLRNVYALFDFGTTSPQFIQLLSTTNFDQAYTEYTTLSQQRNQSLSQHRSVGGGSVNAALPEISRTASSLLSALLSMGLGLLFSWTW